MAAEIGREGPGEASEGPSGSAAAGRVRRRRSPLEWIGRAGVFVSFVAMVLTFSIARSDSFATTTNLRNVLDQGAVLAVVAAGLTVILATGDFDLSFGATAGLAGAAAVLTMHDLEQSTLVAILVALLVGAAVGAVNGTVVAYGRVPAFIGTLAVASIVGGIEQALTGFRTIYQGVNGSYVQITRERILGVPIPILISLAVIAVVWVLLDFTVFGRRAYALGGSESAARLSGVRTQRVKFLAFVVSGVFAALGGVLITSRGASSFPNSGVGLLLPAYAAAFLGASALGGRRFHPAATYFGVIFMGALATGLLMMQFPSWTTNVVQGSVLGGAVLISRLKRDV